MVKKYFEKILDTGNFECADIEVAVWHNPEPVSLLLRHPGNNTESEIEIFLEEFNDFIVFLQNCREKFMEQQNANTR
jgi:hypothetical protein